MLLEKMKTGVSKYLMMVLAVLLIASFAFWGVEHVGGIFTGGSRNIAEVGGTAVTPQEFREQFRREMNRIRARIGEVDMEQARALGLADATLNGIVSRRLLALQANDLGLLISDEQLVARIHEQPAFRNSLGQFDRMVFRNTLANNGLSEAEYVRSLRQDLQQDYLGGAITTGVTAPAPLADAIFRYRNEKRSTEVVRVQRTTLEAAARPSEDVLTAWYEKNSGPFMAPEYRTVTVLYLDPAEVAKEMTPTRERVAEEYESRLSSLSIPERRRIEQILLKDEETAQKAYAMLSEGRSFSAVAKEIDGKTEEEIKLGLVAPNELLPDLGNAVFALKDGAFTRPVKSPLGWHILKVVEIQPGHKPALAEVEKEIAADIAKDLAQDDLVRRANKIEDALAGGASVEEAGNDIGVKARKVGPIDAAKKLQAGTPVDGLPADGSFVETLFATEKGKASNLLETAGGGYFILRVDDILPPAKRPLADVRDAVERAWKLEQLDATARKTAEEVHEEAKSGKSLAAIAEARKLTFLTGAPVSRFATTDTVVPRGLLPDIFKEEKDGVVMGQTESGYAVARVTGIAASATDAESGDYKRLVETISAAISNDLVQEYTRALRKEYPVTVNRAAIDAFYAQP